MPLPVQDQFRYWGIATAIFVVVLWYLGNVLLPFVMGAAIAYFLDPVADRLENMGFSRAVATGIIAVFAVMIVIILALAVIPTLIQQAVQLFETAPQLFQDLRGFVSEKFPSLLKPDSPLHDAMANVGQTIQQRGGELLNTVLSSAASLLNVLMIMLIAPVVAVYLLLDWDRMIAHIDSLLPLDHKATVRAIAKDVDGVLSGFVRGMGSVCMILGVYYAVALMLVGLNFGLVVGLVAGMLTFIPYVGALVGGVLAVGLALFQYWGSIEVIEAGSTIYKTDWIRIVIVWAIFQSGQLLEGNFLTPKLVGSSVGLHPVWLLLALSVFGSLFGFVGMLIAVPLAAAIGVIARFGTGQYTQSRLYKGVIGRDQDL
ncbi:MAG: AI-2E family transporter [Pelagimonas sp.]|jgi:predicted PurR-regulated permease PerM|nr:AI-2E family transporter [Pelagimonas sp.]